MPKNCVLYDKKCTDCGECLVCDLDGNKKCNNCGKCIDEVDEYRTINVQEFIEEKEDKKKFEKQIKKKRT